MNKRDYIFHNLQTLIENLSDKKKMKCDLLFKVGLHFSENRSHWLHWFSFQCVGGHPSDDFIIREIDAFFGSEDYPENLKMISIENGGESVFFDASDWLEYRQSLIDRYNKKVNKLKSRGL